MPRRNIRPDPYLAMLMPAIPGDLHRKIKAGRVLADTDAATWQQELAQSAHVAVSTIQSWQKPITSKSARSPSVDEVDAMFRYIAGKTGLSESWLWDESPDEPTLATRLERIETTLAGLVVAEARRHEQVMSGLRGPSQGRQHPEAPS